METKRSINVFTKMVQCSFNVHNSEMTDKLHWSQKMDGCVLQQLDLESGSEGSRKNRKLSFWHRASSWTNMLSDSFDVGDVTRFGVEGRYYSRPQTGTENSFCPGRVFSAKTDEVNWRNATEPLLQLQTIACRPYLSILCFSSRTPMLNNRPSFRAGTFLFSSCNDRESETLYRHSWEYGNKVVILKIKLLFHSENKS